MAQKVDLETLTQLVRPMVAAFGLSLWGVEFLPAGRKSALRVYVESPQALEGPGTGESGEEMDPADERTGVLLDQCAEVSRHLSVALDAEDAIPGSYTLEVSSPGIERRFFNPPQLAGYEGREIDVRLHETLDDPSEEFFIGRKRFRGPLDSVDGTEIRLRVDNAPLRLDWSQVKSARLVFHFPEPAGKDKKKGKKKK